MSELKITTSSSPYLRDLETFMLTYQDEDYEISLSDFNKIINEYGYEDVMIYTDKDFNAVCEKRGVTYAGILSACLEGWLRRDCDYFSFDDSVSGACSIFSVDEEELQKLIDHEDGIRKDLIKMLKAMKGEKDMANTLELLKSNDGQHSLIEYTCDSGRIKYVVCSFYSTDRPVGSQWDWGHYYDNPHNTDEVNLNDALEYMLEKKYITPLDIASIKKEVK